MTTPKQGRVQIIVDGQTWFDHGCDTRELNVGMKDDSTSHVTFTAEFPMARRHAGMTGVAGMTGTVLDGLIRTKYVFNCHDCGANQQFDDRADFDAFCAAHVCWRPPNEEELAEARKAIYDVVNGVALQRVTPEQKVLDSIARRVVLAMRWQPKGGKP